MRKNRRNNAKKERMIMIASSAFVLTALTLTGIYMKANEMDVQEEGYTLDFEQMEDDAQKKADEIAQNAGGAKENQLASENLDEEKKDELARGNTSDDEMDFMPLEVGSGEVEIPGLTGGIGESLAQAQRATEEDTVGEATPVSGNAEAVAGEGQTAEGALATAGNATNEEPQLHFAEADGLLRPVSGEVLLPFSMDGSIYFSTLDQYKYNPALMISAQEGVQILSCADGQVIDIFEDEEIGQAVTVDLGDGYQITYGQLQNITVGEGQYIEEGQSVGFLAPPTKYYSLEGSNLYLKLTADGVPVNPEVLFR